MSGRDHLTWGAMAGKIEKLGLGKRIQELLVAGERNRDEIARVISSEAGVDVSGPTVGRYLKEVRAAAREGAFKTIQDHVDRVVPDDLEALESMEKLCLEWSKEAGLDQIDRVAAAAAILPGEIEAWRDRILSVGDGDWAKLSNAVTWVIKRALFHLARDDDQQERRLKAMRQATSIIELKLRQAGLLDADVKGQVIIGNRAAEYYAEREKKVAEAKRPLDALRKLGRVMTGPGNPGSAPGSAQSPPGGGHDSPYQGHSPDSPGGGSRGRHLMVVAAADDDGGGDGD